MTHRILHGRVALVTGASRGLGLAIACRLAAAGAHLALLARDADSLAAVAEQVRAACPDTEQRVRIYPADLEDDAQVDAAAARCLDDFAAVDILVNNAALQGPIGPLERVDWGSWRRTFQVNLLAPARLCRLLIPGMRARGHGRIINLSGGGATRARPDLSAYAASKCALVRLSETLAEELAGSGIHVNCIAPGALNTRMLDELLAAGPGGASREYAAARTRAGSGGDSLENAADLIVWLASDASAGITGRLLSAVWDDWRRLAERQSQLQGTDIYTLRRIAPADRGMTW
jgi:3-oxoacyl-[acyl-carrier protein] reductase